MGLVGVLALLAAANASANQLSFSSQTLKVEWAALRFAAEGIEVRCEVTVEVSLHSATFTKTRGQLVGYVTSGTAPVETCSGTEGASPRGLDETLPWHVNYSSFTGTLPRITGLGFEVTGIAFTVRLLGENCLYKATAAGPARLIATVSEGLVTGVRADETAPISKASGSFLCPAAGRASGTGTVSVVGAQNGLTVRLI